MNRKRKDLMQPLEEPRFIGLRYVTYRDVCYLICFALIVAGIFKHFEMPNMKLLSPVPVNAQEALSMYSSPTPFPTATPTQAPVIEEETDQQKEIADYVREVFKEDAWKAFKVLSCENASLNPEAVNTAGNYPPGSRDIGVFQINEYWQAIQGKFLFNWKVNVEIAHLLFEENGKSFHLWTCGRKFGL